jgi:ribosome maturation factor RimP
LEVSSPGLDRPLKTSQDFQRAIGKLVTVKLRRPVGEQWRVRGQILTVDPDALVLVTEAAGPEATTRLALNDVVEGKLDVEF